MLIVRNSLQPIVVQRDVHGRFLVLEVNYKGNIFGCLVFMNEMLQANIWIFGDV